MIGKKGHLYCLVLYFHSEEESRALHTYIGFCHVIYKFIIVSELNRRREMVAFPYHLLFHLLYAPLSPTMRSSRKIEHEPDGRNFRDDD